MKTRDELIEAFALAYVTPDMLGRADPAVIMDVAFGEAERLADAFVAERERRAAVASVKCAGCSVSAASHCDVGPDGEHYLCCGRDDCCLRDGLGWSRAPLADATAPEAKKPHNPDDGCAGCEHLGEPYTYMGQNTCKAKFGLAISMHNISASAPVECPKRAPAETVAPALRFTASGSLLSVDGFRYATRERDGYSADAPRLGDDFTAVVRIAARDRAHAERIVAAMLPVGWATK